MATAISMSFVVGNFLTLRLNILVFALHFFSMEWIANTCRSSSTSLRPLQYSNSYKKTTQVTIVLKSHKINFLISYMYYFVSIGSPVWKKSNRVPTATVGNRCNRPNRLRARSNYCFFLLDMLNKECYSLSVSRDD